MNIRSTLYDELHNWLDEELPYNEKPLYRHLMDTLNDVKTLIKYPEYNKRITEHLDKIIKIINKYDTEDMNVGVEHLVMDLFRIRMFLITKDCSFIK